MLGSTPEMIVGVGDCKVSNSKDTIITTYALGSCLGITAFDAKRNIGGLLHAMLPDSRNSDKAQKRTAMYVDSGMQELFTSLQQLGADIRNLELKVFGAAKVLEADRFFRIGDKNILAMQTLAQMNQLRVTVWEVGGNVNRTIKFNLADGKVKVRMPNQPEFYR